jgi:2-polyprenyl-6-methoxyphenol hydroxylase-like FAD-dependent oxidoreductase
MGSASAPPDAESNSEPHILIIGAGITGLLLAQSLRKRRSTSPSLPTPKFSVFERDPTPSFRSAGWGLTIHWALNDFISLLPQYLVDRLPETFVNPDAVERGETGNFLLYDLQTGQEKYRVPPNKRIRVSRERLKGLLMDALDIQVRLMACHVCHGHGLSTFPAD